MPVGGSDVSAVLQEAGDLQKSNRSRGASRGRSQAVTARGRGHSLPGCREPYSSAASCVDSECEPSVSGALSRQRGRGRGAGRRLGGGVALGEALSAEAPVALCERDEEMGDAGGECGGVARSVSLGERCAQASAFEESSCGKLQEAVSTGLPQVGVECVGSDGAEVPLAQLRARSIRGLGKTARSSLGSGAARR